MKYNCDFSLAALFLGVLLICIFLSRKMFPSKENKSFFMLSILVTLTTAINLVSAYTIENYKTVPLWINYVVNTAFYMVMTSCWFMFVNFLCEVANDGRKKKRNVSRIVALVVYLLIELFIVINIFTNCIFGIGEDGYYYGILFYFYHPLSLLLVFIGYFNMIFSKKHIGFLRKCIFYMSAPYVVAMFIHHIFLPSIIVSDFAMVVVCIALFESLQSPSYYLKEEYNCFNEIAFQKMIDMKIAKKEHFTVLVYEFDGFSYVNRFLGVENGDILMQQVTEEVSQNINGPIYYLGENRFAIILRNNSYMIKNIYDWLSWRFLSTFEVNGVEVNLTCRVCAVNYPEIAVDKDEIVNAISYTFDEMCDDNGSELVWATKERISSYQRNTLITHILKRAIIGGEFEVYYQPIFNVKRNAFISAEALVRLKDEELGYIAPEEFIPIAEKNGLIIEIGNIVFEQVCEFISSGAPASHGIQFIEVNLSMVQCMKDMLHKELLDMLDQYRIPYSMIDFEITETLDIKDNRILINNMNELINVGCTFALDDFGTGFSNINYLMNFPFTIVKLDKSFVWGALEKKEAGTVLKNSIAMISELDKKIVAEGVETLEQARILIELGCEYLQGYYFSPPVSKDRFLSYLETQARAVEKRFLKE